MIFIALLVQVVLVVVVAFVAIGIYNKLVSLRNSYKNAYAQIDVQLKRRYDLIPNLLETVKKYMSHERETLEAVIQARNSASNANKKVASDPGEPNTIADLASAEGALTGSLGRLFALSENYPDLRSNQNMLQLQNELSSTENRISLVRQAYNEAVTRYNTAREVFPSVYLANMLKFAPAALFEIHNEEEREPVRVTF